MVVMAVTDGLLVIALDCADYRLVERWGCQNIGVDSPSELETFTHSRHHPYTPEVWTTVSTGLHPSEHGITFNNHTWENPVLDAASEVTKYLPTAWRETLGKPFVMRGEDRSFDTTDASHVFEPGAAIGWPGITPARNLGEAWKWTDKAEAGELTTSELDSRVHRNMGSEILEAVSLLESGSPVVGVHSHILDVYGHVFANREDELRRAYLSVDGFLGWVLDRVENVVIMSDHGIQTGFLGDETPGDHSHDALFATTLDADPPRDMFGVRDWIEHNSPDEQSAGHESLVSDTTREQLQDLGYV